MFIILFSCIYYLSLSQANSSILNAQTNEEEISKIIAKLTIQQKIGQLLLIGFKGPQIDQSLSGLLSDINPGGLIVFGRNIKSAQQISKLNNDIQKLGQSKHQLPLLIATDQEGGKVTRIKLFPPLPSGRSIGISNDKDLAFNLGLSTGNLLHILGFNMNLAPVFDLSDAKIPSFIGTRSFGNIPEQVSKLTLAYARGLIQAKVLPTAKHYPGHGAVMSDSHTQLPISYLTYEKLKESHLVPYLALSNSHNHISSIMVAHVLFPKIDRNAPATYSKIIINDILRNDLKYEGIVLTDDLQMKGAKDAENNIGERAVRALLAGNDMIMVSWGIIAQKKVFSAILDAYKNGQITNERINESLTRILIVKKNLGIFENIYHQPSIKTLTNAFQSGKIKKHIFDIFKKNFLQSIAKLKLPNGFLSSKSDTLIVFSDQQTFLQKFKSDELQWNSVTFTTDQQSLFLSQLQKDNTFGIFHLNNSTSAKIINRIANQTELSKKIIVINTDDPGYIQNQELFAGIINLHTYHPKIGQFIFDFLSKHHTNKISKY